MWMGPDAVEAQGMFLRARELGMSQARALALAQIASFEDGWAFRSTIARKNGNSIRTVQRAITQGADIGLIGKARSKKDEVPRGATGPIACSYSHRWVIGRGKAGRERKEAIDRYRYARTARKSVEAALAIERPNMSRSPVRAEYQHRKWTAAELEAELAKQLPDALQRSELRLRQALQIADRLEALPPARRGYLISRIAAELARNRAEGVKMLEAFQRADTFITDAMVRELERRLALHEPPTRVVNPERELERLIAKYGKGPPE